MQLIGCVQPFFYFRVNVTAQNIQIDAGDLAEPMLNMHVCVVAYSTCMQQIIEMLPFLHTCQSELKPLVAIHPSTTPRQDPKLLPGHSVPCWGGASPRSGSCLPLQPGSQGALHHTDALLVVVCILARARQTHPPNSLPLYLCCSCCRHMACENDS